MLYKVNYISATSKLTIASISTMKTAWHVRALCPGWEQRPQRRRGAGFADTSAISNADGKRRVDPVGRPRITACTGSLIASSLETASANSISMHLPLPSDASKSSALLYNVVAIDGGTTIAVLGGGGWTNHQCWSKLLMLKGTSGFWREWRIISCWQG